MTRTWPRRMRRVLIGFAGLVGILLLGLLGTYVALQTSWGRAQVQERVRRALAELLQSDVQIGGLEGSILGRVVLTDVVAKDRAGREAVRVGRVEASYDLLSLIHHTVHVDSLTLSDPEITAQRDAAGHWNLLDLVPPPSKGTEPSLWRVVIDDARVDRGRLSLDKAQHIDDVSIRLALVQANDTLHVKLGLSQAHFVEQALTTQLSGQIRQEGTEVAVENLLVEAGESKLAIPSLRAALDGQRVSGRVALDVKVRDLRRFVPETPWRADLVASGTLEKHDETDRFHAGLAGSLAGSPWSLTASAPADARAIEAKFVIDAIDPAAVWATAPTGLLHVEASADLAGLSLGDARGNYRMSVRGRLDDLAFDEVVADGTIAGGELKAAVSARAVGVSVDAEGALCVACVPLLVRSARVQGTVPHLGGYLARLPALAGSGADGDVRVNLAAVGPIDNLAVEGTVDGSRLRYQEARVADLSVLIDMHGIPRDPVGQARILATGVMQGATLLGDVRAEARFRDLGRAIDVGVATGDANTSYAGAAFAHVAREPDGGTRVEVSSLQLRVHSTTWMGRLTALHLHPNGIVDVEGAELGSPSGRVRLDGRFGPDGERVEATLSDLRLRALVPLLPSGTPPLRGIVNAHLVAARNGKRTEKLQLKVSGRGLAWAPYVDAFSIDVASELAKGILRTKVSGGSERTGKLDVQADLRVPKDLLDMQAWRRLDARSLRRAHVKLVAVDLGRVAKLAKFTNKLQGRVDVVIDAGPALSTLQARLDVVSVTSPYIDRPVSAQAHVGLSRGHLSVSAHGAREGGGQVTLEARVRAPAPMTSAKGWQRLSNPRSIETLALSLEGIDLAWLTPLLPPGTPPLSGLVEAKLSTTPNSSNIEGLRVTASARDLAWGPGVDPLSVDVDATLLDHVLSARLSVDGKLTGKAEMQADVRVPSRLFTIGDWKRLDERSLLGAHLKIAGLNLGRLATIAGLNEKLTGHLQAVVHAGPALSNVDARIDVARLSSPYVDHPVGIAAHIGLAPGHSAIEVHMTREGGGRATLEARLAAPARLFSAEGWRRLLTPRSLESVTLNVDAIALAWFGTLRQRLPIENGKLAGLGLTVAARGDEIQAELHIDGARANGVTAPIDAHVSATLSQDTLIGKASTTLGGRNLVEARFALGAGIAAFGAKGVEAFLPARLTSEVHVVDLPLALLRSTFELTVPMDGTLTVHAGVTGSLASPAFAAKATLEGAQIAGTTFGRFEMSGQFDPEHAAAHIIAAQQGGGELDADIEINPRDPGLGSARIQATAFDLGFLAALGPTGIRVKKGLLDADLKLTRTAAPEGWLKLTAAELRVTELLETFREANVDLKVARTGAYGVVVRSSVGREGHVDLNAEGHLAGLEFGEAHGTFATSSLSVSTGRSKVGVDVAGRFTGKPGNGYGLNVVLERALLKLPNDMVGAKLHSTGPLADVVFVDAAGRRDSRQQALRTNAPLLRVHLGNTGPIVVRSEAVEVNASIDLDVTLHPSHSVLLGTASINGGHIDLSGRRWNFQNSRVSFDGSVPANPSLDITINHEFRASTVSVSVAGSAEKPEIAFGSSGTYDKAQLLRFVLGGSPDDASGSATEGDLSAQALSAAGSLLFGQVQPHLRAILPVDVLSVKQASGSSSGSTITVGKWIRKDLFVGYNRRFTEQSDKIQNSNEASLEWYVLRGTRIDLLFGDRSQGSADMLWINRW